MHATLKRNYQLMPALKWLRLLLHHVPGKYEHSGSAITAITPTVPEAFDGWPDRTRTRRHPSSLTSHRQMFDVKPVGPGWLLAADFDKSTWKDDITAFKETCDSLGVPIAIERSRSGNGAHAWFFFNAPVSANAARRMGCYLLTETMSRRHQLSMESYDRLFPNQDTMPRGGSHLPDLLSQHCRSHHSLPNRRDNENRTDRVLQLRTVYVFPTAWLALTTSLLE